MEFISSRTRASGIHGKEKGESGTGIKEHGAHDKNFRLKVSKSLVSVKKTDGFHPGK